MIKDRQDCTGMLYDKNQKNADYKLSIFKELPIKHECLTVQPLLEKIDID